MDWPHLAWKLLSKTCYWRKERSERKKRKKVGSDCITPRKRKVRVTWRGRTRCRFGELDLGEAMDLAWDRLRNDDDDDDGDDEIIIIEEKVYISS